MVLLSCRYSFYWCRVQMKKKKKEKKNIKNRKLKQKINNDHFLLRFHNTAFDVIFVQVIFSILDASSCNFKNKGKYYLHLRSTEGQWLIVWCVKSFWLEFSFYFSYTRTNFRHVFFGPPCKLMQVSVDNWNINLSHENKKTLSPFYYEKTFLIENECEALGVLHSFSIKNIFYDKVDLRLFYFDVET